MAEQQQFLRCSQVCKWLGISRNTLQRLQERKEIPYVQIGRVKRIPCHGVETFIIKHLHGEAKI